VGAIELPGRRDRRAEQPGTELSPEPDHTGVSQLDLQVSAYELATRVYRPHACHDGQPVGPVSGRYNPESDFMKWLAERHQMARFRFKIHTAMALIAEAGVLMSLFVWAFRDDPGVGLPILIFFLTVSTYVVVRIRQSTRRRRDGNA
jgi:hypothetical protein